MRCTVTVTEGDDSVTFSEEPDDHCRRHDRPCQARPSGRSFVQLRATTRLRLPRGALARSTHGAKRFMIPSETGDRRASCSRSVMVLPVDAGTLNWTLYISWTLTDVSYFHRKLTMQVRMHANTAFVRCIAVNSLSLS